MTDIGYADLALGGTPSAVQIRVAHHACHGDRDVLVAAAPTYEVESLAAWLDWVLFLSYKLWAHHDLVLELIDFWGAHRRADTFAAA